MSNDNEYMRQYMAKRYHEQRARAVAALGGKCVVCGSVENLEIDHKDRNEKGFSVGVSWSTTPEKFAAEIAKCQLLCRLHHRQKTAVELGWKNTSGEVHQHGTIASYRKRKCRCDLCRAAKSDDVRRRRIAKGLPVLGPVKDRPVIHGKHSTYVHHKCRCDLCREANRVHCAKYR